MPGSPFNILAQLLGNNPSQPGGLNSNSNSSQSLMDSTTGRPSGPTGPNPYNFGGINSPQSSPFYGQGYAASTANNSNSGQPGGGTHYTGSPDLANQLSGINSSMDPGSMGDQLYQSLLQNLQAIAASGGGGGDFSAQANQQAALKYDPLIKAVQQQSDNAKTNTNVASGKIGELYGSLGKALAAQMPVITNQFSQAQSQSQNNYKNLQDQIANNYQSAQQSQADQLKQLGIEAALPQATEGQTRDRGYLTSQAANNGQAVNDAMGLMGQGESDFAQRASMIAPMEGTNQQADLAQKLVQLQNNFNQQITGYKGQQASEASALMAQLQNQYSSNQSKSINDAIDQAMKLAQYQQLVNPTVFGRITGTAEGQNNSSPQLKASAAVSDFLGKNVTDTNEAAQLKALFDDMLASNTTNPETLRPFYQTDGDKLKAMLAEAQQNHVNLSPQDQQYLRLMLEAYAGKI